ncbi:Gfo/Idh/MocA family protein [Sediminispirochaeta smaragdinae]|uniref:Oxidoreductase domain protein n=1 Tax=Sediminispirochaeta smaragdinae (strain DSM 11293 / JCM 15392 / SEBR 4228) TaxID=573413 RepID=E1RBW3_SEDSS|nr:Gfo/Idh/MocA family oxidoreductase [Sediminispirochaeta smaragdinae]ADK79843.1 oxidoreductase domain protein [Sediminispirochaeta smaragdinae DSM 11293]
MNIGIVGAGAMAAYHVKGFKRAGASVLAVADFNKEKAESFGREFGIKKTCKTLEEMLQTFPELDAVSIATPNKFHASLAIEALEKGKHVYCEKPPARNAKELQGMIHAAENAKKILMFGFNNRARPEAQAMATYIREGVTGRINSAQATWIRRAGIPGFGGWFTDKELAGGGAVIDLLHMIDLALYFMGHPEPRQVLAVTFNDFMGNPHFKGPWGVADGTGKMNVETACHAMVTFQDGRCLLIRNSWAEMNEREEVSVTFQGAKAGGVVEGLFGRDGYDETIMYRNCLFTEEFGRQVNREIITERDETMGRIANAENFVQGITGEADVLNTPSEALVLMRIIDAIYESARTSRCISL